MFFASSYFGFKVIYFIKCRSKGEFFEDIYGPPKGDFNEITMFFQRWRIEKRRYNEVLIYVEYNNINIWIYFVDSHNNTNRQ